MNPSSYRIWLRRNAPFTPNPTGVWRDLTLSAIGNAAARETLATATPHMATIWTDLFQSIVSSGPELRWVGDGPGIGRDARIAYSSLLGRYMARAYLTEQGSVRLLVPLDVMKRELQETSYEIAKDPRSRGLEADWIGLDDSGLVIVEAKGTFDKGVRTWRGPSASPRILQTAIKQAERTAVFQRHTGRKLPATRWAIASRWGTDYNQLEPTLFAWSSEQHQLADEEYQELARCLIRADLGGVLRGLGHSEAATMLGVSEPSEYARSGLSQSLHESRLPPIDLEPADRAPGDIWIRVGAQTIEPGFAAAVGPFGVQPIRGEYDVHQVRMALELNLNLAVVSLSSRYATTASHEQRWPELLEVGQKLDDTDSRLEQHGTMEDTAALISNRSGLTVVWLNGFEDISLAAE